MKVKLILYSLLLSMPLLGNAATIDHFVTTWKTDNPGESNNTSIIVPMVGGPYNVDWNNDGVFDQFDIVGNVTHDFGVVGTYTIRIDGSYRGIYFNNSGDKNKILSIDQWGTQAWDFMRSAFYGCSVLEIPATDTPNFSLLTDMDYMFALAPLANPDTTYWDTSSVTNMNLMFFGASSATPNTSNWNTSSVKQMVSMFESASLANPDTSNWDTSSVELMQFMFAGAVSANPDTSNWDTSSVRDMHSMFEGASSANPNTSGWNTSAVVEMQSMFRGATIANPDTSNWNTSLVTSMSMMFRDATKATPDTSGWDTSRVASFAYMFFGATLANPDTSNWNTSSSTNMRYMFAYATLANPDTSNWDTSSVTSMRNMFYRATSANIDARNWIMSKVSDTSFMFRGVTLSQSHYEGLLIGWASQTLRYGLSFDGGTSTYCSQEAVNARNHIITTYGWNIVDGGRNCTEPPINSPPNASFILEINENVVNFTDTSTDDKAVTSWNWNFGDGNVSTTKNPIHTYVLPPGVYVISYTVTLTVQDAEGESDSYTDIVNINITPSNDAPNASFTFIVEENTVTFTDTSTDDKGVTSWNWNFGDDNFSTIQNPIHTYTLPPGVYTASYTVTLTVQDAEGESDSYTDIVNINMTPPPPSGDPISIGLVYRVEGSEIKVCLESTPAVCSNTIVLDFKQ